MSRGLPPRRASGSRRSRRRSACRPDAGASTRRAAGPCAAGAQARLHRDAAVDTRRGLTHAVGLLGEDGCRAVTVRQTGLRGVGIRLRGVPWGHSRPSLPGSPHPLLEPSPRRRCGRRRTVRRCRGPQWPRRSARGAPAGRTAVGATQSISTPPATHMAASPTIIPAPPNFSFRTSLEQAQVFVSVVLPWARTGQPWSSPRPPGCTRALQFASLRYRSTGTGTGVNSVRTEDCVSYRPIG